MDVNKTKVMNNLTELNALISQLPGHFYWKDIQGYYLGCSESLLKVLGTESENLVGKTDQQLWPKRAGVLKEYDEQAITSRNSITIEETITLPSGEEKILLVTRRALEDKEKNVIGVIGNLFDITSYKKKEMKLKMELQKIEFDLQNAKEEAAALNKIKHKSLENSFSSEEKKQTKETYKKLKTTELLPEHKISFKPSRILIVEDHPITAKITKTILLDFNCQVDIAVNGESAILQAQTENYDLILMDIGLPDIDGCEVTRQIRQQEEASMRHIPIVGLTARVDGENKQRSLRVGMNAVLSKPLMKEKVQDIFTSFIPNYGVESNPSLSVEHSESIAFIQTESSVIDLALGARLIGADEALAKEAILMMINSFPEELMKLEQAFLTLNWYDIQEIVHKLLGGTSYCGTPRLKEACIQLNDYLKLETKEIVIVESLYQKLLVEIDAIQAQI